MRHKTVAVPNRPGRAEQHVEPHDILHPVVGFGGIQRFLGAMFQNRPANPLKVRGPDHGEARVVQHPVEIRETDRHLMELEMFQIML